MYIISIRPRLLKFLILDQSRAKFKEYVNSIAMVKHENNVKYLVLKKENANSSNKNNTISKSHTNTKTPNSKPSKSVSDNVLHSSIASTSNEHLRVPESNTVCVEAEINPDHKVSWRKLNINIDFVNLLH